MKRRALVQGVECLAAIDWSRRLFDSFVPTPDGTSYNAYLVSGRDRTVLIDSVEPTMAPGFLAELPADRPVDDIVSLHAEQDHSGTIPLLLQRFPAATVHASPKAKGMLVDLLHVPEKRIETVADGDTLELGGRTLKFIHTPWVHWPETMCAYLVEERILFSCDLFGAHLATGDLYAAGDSRALEAAKRYYAEIMMPFAQRIERHLEKLDAYELRMIAPSHGPVHWPAAPIVQAYRRWTSGPPHNQVAIAYESMHGSTQVMVERLADALVERCVLVDVFQLSETDVGKLAMALVDAATLVLATPTVLAGPHPNAVHAAFVVGALRPRIKYLCIMGSYGWGPGKTTKLLTELTKTLSAEVLPPVMVKGRPSDDALKELDALAENIAAKHADLKLQ